MRIERSVRGLWGLCLLGAAFVLAYGRVLFELAAEWRLDENYSHGYFVLPVSAYLVWRQRATLRAIPVNPSWLGAVVVGFSLLVLLAGTAGIEYFLIRVSLIGVLAGGIIFLLGWAHFRALSFPVAFLFLMVPLPAIVFNQIAFPLQLFATKVGVGVMQAVDVPVLREGNVIVLATSTLEVAEACSGIRSLVSLLTIALVYGYISHDGAGARVALALSAVPTAILTNALRVAGTGVIAHHYGVEAATGFFHTFSGWIVFVASLAVMMGVDRLCSIAWPVMRSAPPAREVGSLP